MLLDPDLVDEEVRSKTDREQVLQWLYGGDVRWAWEEDDEMCGIIAGIRKREGRDARRPIEAMPVLGAAEVRSASRSHAAGDRQTARCRARRLGRLGASAARRRSQTTEEPRQATATARRASSTPAPDRWRRARCPAPSGSRRGALVLSPPDASDV